MRSYCLIIIFALLTAALTAAGDDQKAMIKAAMEQDPPAIAITTGYEIPSEGYCDQPYVQMLPDGTWLCVMTTGTGDEGDLGQHIVSTRSRDHGKTWEPLTDIEPRDGPEASWATPYLTPYGRVYVFYTYNYEDRREVKMVDGVGVTHRVDLIGKFALKYSDDGGESWSTQRWFVPIRETKIDRENPYQGKVRFFWSVDKMIAHEGASYLGFSKVSGIQGGAFHSSEAFFLRCDNIDSERDPAKLTWQLLPETDRGLTSPEGLIASEVNMEVLSDGSFFCTYRTVDGYPGHAYSRDKGRTWTESAFMTYGPDGERVKHPRAANFVRKLPAGPYKGRYIYWFHNNSMSGFVGRNPAYLLGGIEVDSPEGKVIQWGDPVAVLYGESTEDRISYPDFMWDDGLYITETQKSTARVHQIPDNLLSALWQSPRHSAAKSN